MDVLFYLGLVSCTIYAVLHKRKAGTQDVQSPFNIVEFGADFAQPFGSVFNPYAVAPKEEEAEAFLLKAREELAHVYARMATTEAGTETPDLLHEAFKEKWKEICWLAEAKFGDLNVTYALTSLRLDRHR